MLKFEPRNTNFLINAAKLFTSISDKNKEILEISEKIIDKAIEYNPK